MHNYTNLHYNAFIPHKTHIMFSLCREMITPYKSENMYSRRTKHIHCQARFNIYSYNPAFYLLFIVRGTRARSALGASKINMVRSRKLSSNQLIAKGFDTLGEKEGIRIPLVDIETQRPQTLSF